MTFAYPAFWQSEFDEHEVVAKATRQNLSAPFEKLLTAATASIKAGGKIYRISILATGQQPSLRQVFLWLRQP